MLDIPQTETIVAALAAARTGSMAAAAAEMGVTHGAISRRIQSLEHWLGAPIFERGGRGVELTVQGRIFIRRAERALAGFASIRSDLSSQRHGGAVRISALPSMARLWVMPRLAGLEAQTGIGNIELVSEHRLARLDAREADIALRYGAGTWPGASTQPLFDDHVIPAAASQLAETLAGCTPARLLGETLIVDGDGADWRSWFRKVDTQFSDAGNRRRFVDYDLAVEAARQGLGVILLRLPLAVDAVRSGALKLLDFASQRADRGHHILCRPNESRPHILTLVRALRDMAAVDGANSGAAREISS